MRLIIKYPTDTFTFFLKRELTGAEMDEIQALINSYAHWYEGYDALIRWLDMNGLYRVRMPTAVIQYDS
jgi:hypothetical protein